MGWDLIASKKCQNIMYNCRDENENNENTKENYILDSFRISASWRDSEPKSWPQSLQYFWFHIIDYESAQFYSKEIKKYYDKDEYLIQFANWLEKFDNDIVFDLSM